MEPVRSSARFLSLTEGSLTITEVTYYGPALVDRLNRAPVGRAAQLGLSLVWLCALGHRRGAGHCRSGAAPHRPTLRRVRATLAQRQSQTMGARARPPQPGLL